jgi:PAS domain S-box-containing protein
MTNAEGVAAEAAELGARTPLFRALVESMEQCACLLDPQGRHLAVNRPYCDWLGLPEAEVLGRTPEDLWPQPLADRFRADRQRVLRGERLESQETWPRQRRLAPVRAVSVPVRDDQGRVRAQLTLFGEIPRPVPAEDHRQAARLEALGRLAAGAAHDFNNLLTLIRGHLALLGEETAPVPREQAAAVLDRVLLHGTDLAQQMLALARQESPEFRSVDLNAVASDVTALVRVGAGARLQVDTRLRPGLARVLAAPGQLAQILLNLCLNSRDAMPHGGRLLVETDEVERPARGPDGREHGPPAALVRLRVSDTGEGMGPEVRARIFDPFFTTKQHGRGTGLGLAVVAEIVRQHGGWVECDSSPGGGTRFEVFLPATTLVLPESAEPAPGPPRPAGGTPVLATVLLADNDTDVVRISRTVLERERYRVLTAFDGREAVDVYRREGDSIGVVLLDRNMPEMSGEEVLRELLRLDPGVRVIMASGYSLADLSPETQAHLRGFLAKPYRPTDLVRAVESALADDKVTS